MTILPVSARRTVRRVIAVLALAFVAGIVPVASATASTGFSGGTLTAAASCNRYQHTMTLQASMVLSERFPQGAYAVTRYAYYTVNASTQQRTSAITTTGWLSSVVSSSTRYIPDTGLSGGFTVTNQASALPALRLNAWGQFRVMVQVGIWNGSYYEYSGWDSQTWYDNYGQFGIYSVNSVCLASVT